MRGRVVLGVSGGIAAFRAVEVLRGLSKAGCRVHTILTRNAARFVGPRTFSVLSSDGAETSLWGDPTNPAIDHVALARRSDLLLVAPATANVLAKMASGVADDALTTYALAHRGKVVVAPAMNSFMWRHPATRNSLDVLAQRGVTVVPPAWGELADGDVGEGKLAAVDAVVAAALAALPPRGPLAGLSMVVTAGPTREPIDAVRVITNRSSGRMGVSLALEAQKLGARVRLLAGPGVEAPASLEAEPFVTALELGEKLARWAPQVDVVWHAAAVADFRPAQVTRGKLDRRKGEVELLLAANPDLAAAMPRENGRPYLVIFAAELTGHIEQRAQKKLREKRADAVVANPIDEEGVGMEVPRNRAIIFSRLGLRRELPAQDKASLAREMLLSLAAELLMR